MLVERWLDAIRDSNVAFVELPTLMEFTAGDVARAYGTPSPGRGLHFRVQLRSDPSPDMTSDSFLTIGPPDGSSDSADDYLTWLCNELAAARPP